MADVSPLYHPLLLRHARQPRLRGVLSDVPHHSHDGLNRSCGDRVTLHVAIVGDTLRIRFEGEGCQLSLGSASAICEAVDGQSPAAAEAILTSFVAALEGAPAVQASPSLRSPDSELPGELALFLAVRAFPARMGCVRLAPDTCYKLVTSLAHLEEVSPP